MPKPVYKLLQVTEDNIEDMYCSRSKRKDQGYQNKIKWIRARFKEGLKYWSLLVDEGKKDGSYSYRGMIEAIPGEKRLARDRCTELYGDTLYLGDWEKQE